MEVANRNQPDGKGFDNEGQPPSKELARHAAEVQAFGSQSANDAWSQFGDLFRAFVTRHEAADRSVRRRPEGVADTDEAMRDRAALANAFDQLADGVQGFREIVRDDLGTD
jgi:hypothetical protein